MIQETTLTPDALEHVPWGGLQPTKSEEWRPKGSAYSPTAFKRALTIARNPPRPMRGATFGSIRPRTDSKRRSERRASFRKALVFEREITLNTDGKSKRWSVQVPATTMNPEMVDMMLELQGLNTFFKDGLEDLDQPTVVLALAKDKVDAGPPSLMVSDSHCVLPLSIESSGQLTHDLPIPLAARRGKNLLPPLALKPSTLQNTYPSIPSAFMGSPSAYSPKFEHANGQNDSSLGLVDMVSSLRSQCAYPQRGPYADCELSVDSPMSAISFASASDQVDDDDDDWAFAVSFLDEYSQPPDVEIEKSRLIGNYPQNMLDVHTQRANSPGLPAVTGPQVSRASEAGSNSPSIYAPSSPIPSSPLPSIPLVSSSRPSSPKGVRSILKSCKNVRFASLPDRSEDTDMEPPISPYIDSPTVAHLQRPRTRTASARVSNLGTENTPVLVTPRSYISKSAYASRHAKADNARANRPVSTPLSTTGNPSHAKRPYLPVSSPPRSSVRQSYAPTRKATPGAGKVGSSSTENENKARASYTPQTSRWTMNDIPFRRGSNAGQSAEGTPRSRMPVPLRNILTRFK